MISDYSWERYTIYDITNGREKETTLSIIRDRITGKIREWCLTDSTSFKKTIS